MDLIDNANDRASLLFAAPESQLDTIRRFRDSIGAVVRLRPEHYAQILQDVIPILIAVLKGGSPQFVANPVQSIRAAILDVFHKLPVTGDLRAHAESIQAALIDVLNRDNELNAFQCLSLIFDLHKAVHPQLESTIPHFMSFYSSMYSNLPRIVASTFPVRPGTPNTPSPSPNASTFVLGRASFRVLAASERVVRLFAQIYPKFADAFLGQLVLAMVKALRSEVSDRHAQKMAQQFVDFTVARVKTLSFLVFALRAYPDRILPHIDDLSKSVFALLRSCPGDAVPVRRELLVQMRQLVSVEAFRLNFRDKTDFFLKMYPQLMVGRGRAAHDQLRPMAAYILVDLVHHIRSDMTLDQLATAAAILCRHMHDPALSFALQSSVVKLLFNLVDPIYQKDKDEAGRPRKIFVAILYALVSKLSSLKALVPALIASVRDADKPAPSLEPPPLPLPAHRSLSAALHDAGLNPAAAADLLRDLKDLVGTTLFGLKTVVWSIKNSAASATVVDDVQIEMALISDFFVHALQALPIFSSELDQAAPPKPDGSSGETVLDNFASIFTTLELRQFQSIFTEQIADLIAFLDRYESELPVFAFPQHFLQNASMCKPFADLILCELLQPAQFKRLSESESVASKTRLNLFRMVLHALTIYSDVEFVIRPHLCTIVALSLDQIASSEDPRAYFLVLRALFRNIGGGTFERLYKEFLPVMPDLLSRLLTVIRSECARDMRNFAVELGLTVPARLSSLLPFLSSLIEIVTFALRSTSDSIIKLGLRTLEFWIDNLELDFLYPLIERNLKSVMLGLCALINQHTAQFGPVAVRILGGLAGRSRQFLADALPPCLTYSSGCPGRRVRISDGVAVAIRDLSRELDRILTDDSKHPVPVVKSAADLAQHLIGALLAGQQQLQTRHLGLDSDMQLESASTLVGAQDGGSGTRGEDERAFSQLLGALITAAGRYDGLAQLQTFLSALDAQFAILLSDPAESDQRFDALVYLDVLLACARSHDAAVSGAAWAHLGAFLNELGPDPASRSHVAIQHVFEQAAHLCHYASRHSRLAGVRVLSDLVDRLPVQWVHANQNELIRSLLFALRDSKSDVDVTIHGLIRRALEHAIRTCSHVDSDITLLVNSLASELTSSTCAVRDCVQNLLKTISQQCHASICDLLKPFRASLLTPVLSRRLHTLAPSTRIGYISATAYALSIDPPLLDVTPEFFDLLMSLAGEIHHDESTSLAGNPSVSPSSSHSGRSRLLMLQRVESIKLLSAALKSPQLQRHTLTTAATPVTPDPSSLMMDSVTSPSPTALTPGALTPGATAPSEPDVAVTNLRNRIIAALFESLRSPHEEVAQVANRGMVLACEQERPPKSLLQSCLRPVLSNFAEYQKLSVPLLTMLSRLLSVLSKCFNVTLAQKLYDHFDNFSRMVVGIARELQTPLAGDQSSPSGSSPVPGPPGGSGQQRFGQWSEVLIPAAILHTFHLLPKLPQAFLQKLVLAVLQLEAIFPILQVYGGCGHGPKSPYRLPLVRFLNHPDYCKDAAFFFVQASNLRNPSMSRLFKDCLRMGQDADRLQKATRDLIPQLLCNAFLDRDDSPESVELRFQAISILDILTSYEVSGCEVAVDRLVAVWDERMNGALSADVDQDVVGAEIGPIAHAQEVIMLARIFIRLYNAHPMSFAVYLWKLLSFLVVRHLSDPTFVLDFITDHVVRGDYADIALVTFLNQLSRVPASYAIKSRALDLIITPIIQRFIVERRELAQHLNVASNVLPPILTGYSSLPDVFNTALSNLAIHLVVPAKSDPLFQASLLQYVWANTRHDQTQAQMNAFVALGRFLESHPPTSSSLEPIRISLFVAVLGAHQASARVQAHDTLRSILPSLAGGDSRSAPPFVLWTRRLLLADAGADLAAHRHILQAVCAFRDVFKPYRSILIPMMVALLDRLAVSGPTSTPDSRQVVLDVADTILSWKSAAGALPPDVVLDDSNLMAPPSLSDLSLLPVLLQIAPDSPVARRMCPSSSDALSTSPISAPAAHSLEPVGSALVTILMESADMSSLRFTCARAQDCVGQFVAQHAALPVRLHGLVPSTAVGFSDAQRLAGLGLLTRLTPLSYRAGVAHMVRFYRDCASSSSSTVRNALQTALQASATIIVDHSDAIADLAQVVDNGLTLSDQPLYTAIAVLKCLVAVRPQLIQSHIGALSRACTILARDCLGHQTADVQRAAPPLYHDASASLLSVLDLLASTPQLPADSYRCLIQTITLLADKSTDVGLLQGVITVLHKWVQNAIQFDSTQKDVEDVIGRLVRFIGRAGTTQFDAMFFRLLTTCSDCGLLWSMSLMPPMLLGLTCADSALRTELVSRVQRYVVMNCAAEVDLKYALLKFVFSDADWQLCCRTGPHHWIIAALQLILSMGSYNETTLIIDDPDDVASLFMHTSPTSSLAGVLARIQPKDVLTSLSDLAVLDSGTAARIWVELFPQIWSTMSSAQRSSLQPLITDFLSRDWHRPHQTANSNLVQILLECFVACPASMTPAMPSDLVGYLGRTYNAWYTSLALLQHQTPQAATHAAIVDMCSALNERDVLAGLWYNIAQADITKSALALQQFSLWPRAQTMFFAALAAVNGQTSLAPAIGVPLPGPGTVSALELAMWEAEWTHAAWQLGQWDVLSACALGRHDRNSHVVAMYKSGDWSETLDEPGTGSDQCLHRFAMSTVRHDADLDRVADRTLHTLLDAWVALPAVVSLTHVPLLAQFHGFVEIQESGAMLADVVQAKAHNKPVDLTSFIKKWRQRLPNEWEDLVLWIDRTSWRLKTFSLIQQQMAAAVSALPQIGGAKTLIPTIDDRMWTLLTLSKVARKQQLGSQCLHALSQTVQISDNPITTNDAFLRLREQIRVCMGSSVQYMEALALINSLNIDYFTAEQKAELFRLKGDALQHLGQGDDANACFSTALSVSETHGKSWLSWANFCDRVFAMKKDREWATWAVSCYMNAIAYGEARARLMITRIIWLLSYDADDRSVAVAFERASEQVPLWTWLLWLPQLLTCLARAEGAAIKLILQRVARIYPQALHYTVRAFLFEKREQHAISGKDGSAPESSSLALVEAIVLAMRENHPSLVTEIENMLEEINLRFQPTPHEELLASVHSLYQKCFKQAVMVSGLSGPIPEPLAGVLARLSRSFFNSPKHVSNPIQSEFVRRYKQAFEADFNSTSRATLAVLLSRLSKWKSHLEFHVTQRRRMTLRLEALSPYLMRFQTYEVEVPGQYLVDKEPSTDQNVLIVRFEPAVAIIRLSHTFLYRRLSLLGTDGAMYHFLVQYSIAHINRSDERMMQLYTIINRLMSRYKETRRRNMMFAVPLVVPLTHRLRLMETHDDVTSFEKIYEQSCSAHGIPPDAPFSVVIEELGQVTDLTPANIRATRLSSFKRIMGAVIPRTLLSDYFHTVIADQELLWAFRKQFAQQMGLNCFLSYILSIGDRSLHKIIVQQHSGRVTFNDFYPSYNAHNMIESSDNVPFRLTPNISTFIGDYLIHGVTAATLVSLSACLLKHQDVLKNYLYLFVRDDLLSWHATKKTVQTDAAQRALEYDVRLQISSNTLQILRGIQSFMATSRSEGEEGHEPINCKVAQLIEQAMSEDNLSNQLPTWHPWF